MKLRVVSSKDEIESLGSDEEIVHFAFRPSNEDVFKLVKACPSIKAIHIPGSYKKTISKSIQMFLEMQSIALLEGDVWGHRKDINEYSEIDKIIFEKIDEFKSDGLDDKEIVRRITRESKLDTDLINFILSTRK